jgi:hypothetical protein
MRAALKRKKKRGSSANFIRIRDGRVARASRVTGVAFRRDFSDCAF